MGVYTSVDPQVRRKLEDLFQTWKVPVVNGMSSQPVFPIDATRKIEEVLIKVRALHQQQQQQQQQQAYPQYPQHPPHPYPQHQQQQQYSQQGFRASPSPFPGVVPNQQQGFSTGNPVQDLMHDVDELMRIFQARLRLDPSDNKSRADLSNLGTLRQLLATQTLPAEQLMAVREQIRSFTASAAQQLAHQARNTPPPALMNAAPQAAHDLFGALARADLLPAGVGTQTPPPPASFGYPPAPVPGNGYGVPPNTYPQTQQQQPAYGVPQSAPTFIPPSQVLQRPRVELSTASLAQARPELIHQLYGAMSLQCGLCGQRWHDTATGKALRDDHLDWHFRVNRRVREHAVRGQARAPYLSEEDWVNFSVSGGALANEDASGTASAGAASGAAAAAGQVDVNGIPSAKQRQELLAAAKRQTIPKPAGLAAGELVCAICQEDFEADYDDAAEEWVLRNAISLPPNGEVVHAACQLEAHWAQLADKQRAETRAAQTQDHVKSDNDSDSVDDYEDDDDEIALPGASSGVKRDDSEPPPFPSLPDESRVDRAGESDTFGGLTLDPEALSKLAGSLSGLIGTTNQFDRSASPPSPSVTTTPMKRKAEDDDSQETPSTETRIKREFH
ncbi:mRNA 3' end processing factor [Savitreella phatthalungensis]